MEGLLRRLQGHMINGGVEDAIVWWLAKGGTFSVKSYYFSLVGCYPKGFPTSLVWNPWVLMKVNFFAWEAFWEKILILDQLKRRG